MWRLVLKNLFRNQRRTLLTFFSVAVSLFLLSSLSIVYVALSKPIEGVENVPLLMVRRLAGIVFPLPSSYQARIKAVPGVVATCKVNWFGGYWVDPSNQLASFAVDPDSVFAVQMASKISPEQLRAFQNERTAAVAGKGLIDKYHWKIGDRITILGSPYGVSPELVLRGIFTAGPDDSLFFHWDYLNEMMGRLNIAGMYWVRVDHPEAAPRVAQTIDRMFRNTDAETKSESLSAFLLGFVSMLGNVRGIILLIGSAVTFATLLIVANTMAMAIRERVSEAAVMRALGFRAAHIFGLFVSESLLLTVGGGLAGVAVAKLLFDLLAMRQIGQFVPADLRMRPATTLLCLLLSIIMAFLASGGPAYRAARRNIAEALRFVG
jgi:putative ABC transport system permease protein